MTELWSFKFFVQTTKYLLKPSSHCSLWMMGFAGAKRGRKDHEKSPESPPAHHLHHHHLTNQSPKSIIWIFLLVIAVDLSCLLLYHSAYQNYLFLATSQYSQESFPSQDSSFRQAKIFSSKIVAEGLSSSLSLDSAQPELRRVQQNLCHKFSLLQLTLTKGTYLSQ